MTGPTLTGITQGSTSVGLAYDNDNRRTALTLLNGIVLAYSYDHDSRVTGMTWTLGSSPVGDLEYSYDADGHVTGRTGSFAQSNTPTPVSGNTFNADNAMTAFNGSALSYDANGNLVNDGTSTYTWDVRNHLSAISGGAAASFVYDAFGRRLSKTVNSTITQFLYDGLNPVQELDGAVRPNVTANLLTGLGIDEYFTRTGSSGAMSFLADALGSTLALTDSGGALSTQYTYEPYGKTAASGPSNANSYQYTGRENDGTGLYFNRARYYSPTFQRFVSQDPIGFASGEVDLYVYSENSPTMRIDPLGETSLSLFGYAVLGGRIAIGINPDNTPFLTISGGLGIGGGFSFDPKGTSPGYAPAQSCDGHGIGYGAGESVGAGIGPFDIGLENGTNVTPNGVAHDYSGSTGGFAFAPDSFKFEAEVYYNMLEFNARLY